MRLVANICVYNSADVIERCLKSLDGVVDRILILDCKWVGFPSEKAYSTDGTLDIIRRFRETSKTEVIVVISPTPMHQHEARNLLLNLVHKDDWILVVDSDETIIKVPENLREILLSTKERGFRVFARTKKGNFYPLPTVKLIKKTRTLCYEENHRYMKDRKGLIYAGDFPTLGVEITHFPEKAMREQMNQYENWLVKWENQKVYKDEQTKDSKAV